MKITEIAFTVLPVTSLKRSRPFYEQLLGLQPTQVWEKDDQGMIEYDIGSGTLAIGTPTELFKPTKDGGAIALNVEDFDGAIAELQTAGATFAMGAMDTGACQMAVLSDPDGNYLIIHRRKG